VARFSYLLPFLPRSYLFSFNNSNSNLRLFGKPLQAGFLGIYLRGWMKSTLISCWDLPPKIFLFLPSFPRVQLLVWHLCLWLGWVGLSWLQFLSLNSPRWSGKNDFPKQHDIHSLNLFINTLGWFRSFEKRLREIVKSEAPFFSIFLPSFDWA